MELVKQDDNQPQIGWEMLTSVQKEDLILRGIASCSYPEITNLQNKIYNIKITKEHEAKQQFMKELRDLSERFGVDFSRFTGGGGAAFSTIEKKKVAPKYQNLQTGQTWAGRGVMPRWIRDALLQGKSIEDFRIKK